MTIQEALNLLTNVTAVLKLSREDHQKVIDALNLLSEALAKKTKKEK